MGSKQISGQVIWVSNDLMSVAINKGSLDGVLKGMHFLIYKLGDELFDPVTRNSLGNLELVCGDGVVKHVQERISTIQSTELEIKHKRIIKHPPVNSIFNVLSGKVMPQEIDEPIEIRKPFEGVSTDCLARLVR